MKEEEKTRRKSGETKDVSNRTVREDTVEYKEEQYGK